MKTFVYFVLVNNEIVFADFLKDNAETYAESYNSDLRDSSDSSDRAIIKSVEVPIAMLRRIPRLSNAFKKYSDNELYPVYKSGRTEKLFYDGDMISIEHKPSVRYMNEEYVYLDNEGMWYLVDGDELVLPDYDVEQEVEAYADVEWHNTFLNSQVVFVFNEQEFTRTDVFMACSDFLNPVK